ncbi:NUDIX domain-containing protein [Ramlibacter sp. PS4R-6]|uniref:NUDIX domain-containing protein n=1 Tax=Ramlibacter sp. PS4R-6 TaxID=3133438 RepID=UPI0030A41548
MTTSAGLLLFRRRSGALEVLLARPGGPWWRGKDAGAWTIPKGEYEAPEQPLDAALREWREETGFPAHPPFIPLGDVKQKAGKRVTAWAFEGDCDPAAFSCNTFEVEWPPKSGRRQSFPELAEVRWFTLDEARTRINEAQAAFLDRLAETA